MALHPWFAFVRNYVLRAGFKDGTVGFIVSVALLAAMGLVTPATSFGTAIFMALMEQPLGPRLMVAPKVKSWMSPAEFMQAFAVGQAAPGPTACARTPCATTTTSSSAWAARSSPSGK